MSASELIPGDYIDCYTNRMAAHGVVVRINRVTVDYDAEYMGRIMRLRIRLDKLCGARIWRNRKLVGLFAL